MKIKEFYMEKFSGYDLDDLPTQQREPSDSEVDAQIDARQQAEIEGVKLCKDCKHYQASEHGVMHDKCRHPKSGKTDPNNFVREVIPLQHYLCSSMRMGLGCEFGILWEAK